MDNQQDFQTNHLAFLKFSFLILLPIPQDLMTLYNFFLIQKAIPETYHPYHRKWLLCYLDLCQKYGFRQSDTKSLTPQ